VDTAERINHEIRARMERVIEHAALTPRHHPYNAELAGQAGMSTPHFERIFRTIYGRSPQNHLTGMRMEAAKRLLITTEMTLGEIAAELGYSNSNVLSNTFLRECGSRPSMYRSYQRLA
jgi:transcriptional regulator GlxA family with amidase domain